MIKNRSGALLNVQPPQDGSNGWTVTQVDLASTLPPPDGTTLPFDFALGPIKVQCIPCHQTRNFTLIDSQLSGTVNTATLGITINPTIVGINLGTISGNLKDGITVSINIFVASGSITLYLKNGNQVWIHYDVQIKFDGSFTDDKLIMALP